MTPSVRIYAYWPTAVSTILNDGFFILCELLMISSGLFGCLECFYLVIWHIFVWLFGEEPFKNLHVQRVMELV